MINAPQGTAVGLPGTTASSCDVAPPPLTGGGLAPARSPLQSPLQVPLPTLGAGPTGAAVVPTNAAGAAALGASSIIRGAAPVAPAVVAPVAIPSIVGTSLAPTSTTAGAHAAAAPTPAASTAGANGAPQRLTTLAPGGRQGDADLVERTLGVLRQSPAGAQVLDRLLAVNARVNVISDAEFQAMGHGSAHAFYDPKLDTMFLRRSDLANGQDARFAALALAHEGTHLLDDVAGVTSNMAAQLTEQIAAAGGPSTARGAEIKAQGIFELTMVKEARAFTFAGQVARELGLAPPANDPTSVAAAGGNDQATYAAVWQRLLQSSYNPERRTAAVRNA